jgi:hypothetical protein
MLLIYIAKFPEIINDIGNDFERCCRLPAGIKNEKQVKYFNQNKKI